MWGRGGSKAAEFEVRLLDRAAAEASLLALQIGSTSPDAGAGTGGLLE